MLWMWKLSVGVVFRCCLCVAVLWVGALTARPARGDDAGGAQVVVSLPNMPQPTKSLWAVPYDEAHALVVWSTLSDPDYEYSDQHIDARMMHVPSGQWVGETVRVSHDAANVQVVALGRRSVALGLNSYAYGVQWWHLREGDEGAVQGSPNAEAELVGIIALGDGALSLVENTDSDDGAGLDMWRLTEPGQWRHEGSMPVLGAVSSLMDIQVSVCGEDVWAAAPSGEGLMDVRRGLFIASPWRAVMGEDHGVDLQHMLVCMDDVPHLVHLETPNTASDTDEITSPSAIQNPQMLHRIPIHPLPAPPDLASTPLTDTDPTCASFGWEEILLEGSQDLAWTTLLRAHGGTGLILAAQARHETLKALYEVHFTTTGSATLSKLGEVREDSVALYETASTTCTPMLEGSGLICASPAARLKLWTGDDLSPPPLPLDPISAAQTHFFAPALLVPARMRASTSAPDPTASQVLTTTFPSPPPTFSLADLELLADIPTDPPPPWLCGPALPVDEDWYPPNILKCDSDGWLALADAVNAYCDAATRTTATGPASADPTAAAQCSWLQRHFSCSHLFAERELSEYAYDESAWGYLNPSPDSCQVDTNTLQARLPFTYYAARWPVDWNPDEETPSGTPPWAKLSFSPAPTGDGWVLDAIQYLPPIQPPFGPHVMLTDELRRFCRFPTLSQVGMCAALLEHFGNEGVPPLSAYGVQTSKELNYCYCDSMSYSGFRLRWHRRAGHWWLHSVESRDCSESNCEY